MKQRKVQNTHIPGDILYEVMLYSDVIEIIPLSMTCQTAQKMYKDRVEQQRIEAMRKVFRDEFAWLKEDYPNKCPKYDDPMEIQDAQQYFTCCDVGRFNLLEEIRDVDGSDWGYEPVLISTYRYIAQFIREMFLKGMHRSEPWEFPHEYHTIKCKKCEKRFCRERALGAFVDTPRRDPDGIEIRGGFFAFGYGDCGNEDIKMCKVCLEKQ